jgi:adenine deaminase
MPQFSISGNIVDIFERRIFAGTIKVQDENIIEIKEEIGKHYDTYIMPGFIDSHIHIESSMLVPSEFARLAVVHGTVATVSDPHEIANVLGKEGVEFMIDNGQKVPFKFYFGAPSCVPATTFETAGSEISVDEIDDLLQMDEINYLSEMMNFPGVIYDFPDVDEKLILARKYGKPIDGHAPGLSGDELKKYISKGITTDHECFDLNEANEKSSLGMKILIREGSAAKNFDTLESLITSNTNMVMFCSDDRHPDDLAENHINDLVKRAIAKGHNLFDVLKVSCINPIEHYSLDVGMLRVKDPADFIVVDDLQDFHINQTYINGELVAQNGKSFISSLKFKPINKFHCNLKSTDDFFVESAGKKIKVIEAIEGQLITNLLIADEKIISNNIVSDVENDVLKLTVVNRYEDNKPAIAFVKNFGLKSGAIATSVGHDSHNIIAVGTSDEEICKAVNLVIEHKGGMVAVDGNNHIVLPLPVAGLMSNLDGYEVANRYSKLIEFAHNLGSKMNAPFMTLSFMALLVIPKIKLSDKGLFDGEKFEFIDLHINN